MRKFEKKWECIVFDCDGFRNSSGMAEDFAGAVPKHNGTYFLKIKSAAVERGPGGEPWKTSKKVYADLWMDVIVHNMRLFPGIQKPGLQLTELISKVITKHGQEYQLEVSFKPKQDAQALTIKT